MSLLFDLRQRWLRRIAPTLQARLARLLYAGPNISIGEAFKCDGIPRCLVDQSAQIKIGKNVEFREGVEIRAHNSARIVIDDDVRIDRGVRILAANDSEVRVSTGARIGLYSVLNGGASIHVGHKCLISGFVYLQTSMHRTADSDSAIRDQGYEHGAVQISDGAWLGAHVVIMPGVSVGHGAVVGSNAVVTRDVAAGLVVAGVPARPLHD